MRVRVILAAVLMAAVFVGLAGCPLPHLQLHAQPRAFTPEDYPNIYERWTREADVFAFGRLSDVLNVTATFQSWEFRWAYVVRYARDHGLQTEERSEMLRATLADAQQHHRFLITLIGPDFRESDLTSRRAAWRVLLVDESGANTTPVEIERIRRPDATIRTYYPSATRFRHAFRVAFPAARADGSPTVPSSARRMILRFTGPVGRVDLRWEFQPSRPSTGRETALTPAPARAYSPTPLARNIMF